MKAKVSAVPAFATGRFHERPVSAALREFFSAVWVHTMPASGVRPVMIAPDGTIDLQWIDGRLRIAGPDKELQVEDVPAGTTVIGFRFRPAAAAAWLRLPVCDIVGQRLALEDLWGTRARRLADHIEDEDPARSLEAVLHEFAPTETPADSVMRAAYALIEAGPHGDVPLVPRLTRSLAISERTLRRRFDESFGYGPKTLDRILRYQRYLRLSRTSPETTAVLAVEAGYADQPHLVRESRRLAGVTPNDHRRTLLTR